MAPIILASSSRRGARRSIDRLAPEHLEISRGATPSAVGRRSATPAPSSSGAYTPEAIGDYVGGSNHVLPTSRSARFSSGLGVLDFLKRTSILKCDATSLAALGPAAVVLGEAEGLSAHARSVALRLAGKARDEPRPAIAQPPRRGVARRGVEFHAASPTGITSATSRSSISWRTTVSASKAATRVPTA